MPRIVSLRGESTNHQVKGRLQVDETSQPPLFALAEALRNVVRYARSLHASGACRRRGGRASSTTIAPTAVSSDFKVIEAAATLELERLQACRAR
jgi:hypothetical protein